MRVKQLDVRIRCEPRRIASLRALDRVVELAQLHDEAFVEQQRPSVAPHQRSTSPSMSSSGPASRRCMFEHVLCQIVRNRPNMPTGLDIAGEQVEKRSDGRIFMLGRQHG